MEGSEDLFTRAMQMQRQTQMEMEASSHVQRKCKKREIRKRSKSIFPRWPTIIALLLIHTCGKRTQILAQEDEYVFITWVDACVFVRICVGWFTRVFRQRVFVLLKKILCHQFLRSFKV